MVRALVATTAIAALLAGTAIAQDASSQMMSSEMPMDASSMMSSAPMDDASMMSSEPMASEAPMDASSAPMDTTTSAPMDTTTSAPMDTTTSAPMDDTSMVSTEPTAPFDIVTGYTQVDTDRLASRIIGQPVYDGTAADANNLGNINDLVLTEGGDVQAVVIGVGGFLGIGEKQVAVAYSALQWVIAADNTERWVIDATEEQLTNAPDFVTVEDDPANDAAGAAGGAVTDPAAGGAAMDPAAGTTSVAQ